MAFTKSFDPTIDNAAGLSIDPTNPAHVAYTAAGVIGAATVTASVGIVTAAAPVVTVAPIAIAGGLVYVGHRLSQTDDAPASKTEPAAA